MKNPFFYLVDVFAENKYAGNQLAVFRNANLLSTAEMQTLAKEMNYSETTFIMSEDKKNNGYEVRIFTPEEELPFAGHPTLGTAFIIQQEIIKEQVDQVNLDLKIGQIPVTFSYKNSSPDLMWMKQKNPVFGELYDPQLIADLLSVNQSEIDTRFPIQDVSTGLSCFIVPLKSLNSVKNVRIDLNKFYRLIKDLSVKTILIFCPETYNAGNNLNVRFFADYLGVPEDPATGSANGCLAGYLIKHRYFNRAQIDIKVEQGYEINRPSLLHLKAEDRGDSIDIFIGGKAFLIAKGELV